MPGHPVRPDAHPAAGDDGGRAHGAGALSGGGTSGEVFTDGDEILIFNALGRDANNVLTGFPIDVTFQQAGGATRTFTNLQGNDLARIFIGQGGFNTTGAISIIVTPRVSANHAVEIECNPSTMGGGGTGGGGTGGGGTVTPNDPILVSNIIDGEILIEGIEDSVRMPTSAPGLGTTFTVPETTFDPKAGALAEDILIGQAIFRGAAKDLVDHILREMGETAPDDPSLRAALGDAAYEAMLDTLRYLHLAIEAEKAKQARLDETPTSVDDPTINLTRWLTGLDYFDERNAPEYDPKDYTDINLMEQLRFRLEIILDGDLSDDGLDNADRAADALFTMPESVTQAINDANEAFVDSVAGRSTSIVETAPGTDGAPPGYQDRILLAPAPAPTGLADLFQTTGNSLTISLDSATLKQALGRGHFLNGDGTVLSGDDMNIWVKGRFAILDGDRDGADGLTGELLVGGVQRVAPRVDVGLFSGFFASDIETSGAEPLDAETQAVKLGVYGNVLLQQGFVAGLSLSGELGQTDVARPTATGSYDYVAIDASASITTGYRLMAWTLQPSAAGTVSFRDTDEHVYSDGTAIPGRSAFSGTLTGSLAASRTFGVNKGSLVSVTPSAVVTGNYYINETSTNARFENASIALGAGLGMSFVGGTTLAATTRAGFGQSTFSYGGQIRLQLPF